MLPLQCWQPGTKLYFRFCLQSCEAWFQLHKGKLSSLSLASGPQCNHRPGGPDGCRTVLISGDVNGCAFAGAFVDNALQLASQQRDFQIEEEIETKDSWGFYEILISSDFSPGFVSQSCCRKNTFAKLKHSSSHRAAVKFTLLSALAQFSIWALVSNA